MSTLTFKDIEEEIKKRFGTFAEEEMDQHIFELAAVIGVDPEAEAITQEHYQRACQLIEIIHQQKAMTFQQANTVLEDAVKQGAVVPKRGLQHTIDQQAEQMIDEIPMLVNRAKQSMQQGIQYALAERVAQKLRETDIQAKVEELMAQTPKQNEPSFLELMGLPPLPAKPDPKRLTGS